MVSPAPVCACAISIAAVVCSVFFAVATAVVCCCVSCAAVCLFLLPPDTHTAVIPTAIKTITAATPATTFLSFNNSFNLVIFSTFPVTKFVTNHLNICYISALCFRHQLHQLTSHSIKIGVYIQIINIINTAKPFKASSKYLFSILIAPFLIICYISVLCFRHQLHKLSIYHHQLNR